jgi:hypothetical protein
MWNGIHSVSPNKLFLPVLNYIIFNYFVAGNSRIRPATTLMAAIGGHLSQHRPESSRPLDRVVIGGMLATILLCL